MREQPLEDGPKEKIGEFAKLISGLASVFGAKEVSTACRIFWKDTDKDLMAFSRKRIIYLNLAHYYRSCESFPCYALSCRLIIAGKAVAKV